MAERMDSEMLTYGLWFLWMVGIFITTPSSRFLLDSSMALLSRSLPSTKTTTRMSASLYPFAPPTFNPHPTGNLHSQKCKHHPHNPAHSSRLPSHHTIVHQNTPQRKYQTRTHSIINPKTDTIPTTRTQIPSASPRRKTDKY